MHEVAKVQGGGAQECTNVLPGHEGSTDQTNLKIGLQGLLCKPWQTYRNFSDYYRLQAVGAGIGPLPCWT